MILSGDYKEDNNHKFSKTEDEIILEAKTRQDNPYIQSKKLVIDGKSGLPKELKVQDNNQNTLVYILYKEIKINSTKKESVVAFKLSDYRNIDL